MRILITNDDGIDAPGLKVAEKIAQRVAMAVAGEAAEIWTLAPAFEQSGVGHCISYTQPFMISQTGPRRFAAEGSPADCVLAAIYEVMPERPDLIISGVNRGNNSAENTLYSGTVGAAMEGALQGIRAVALSQYMGEETASLDNLFEAAEAHGADTVLKLFNNAPWDQDADYGIFYNVNFPPVAAKNVKGVRASTQGFRRDVTMSTSPFLSPSGRKFLWIKGGAQGAPAGSGMDVTNNINGYISVTPMRADLTARDHLAQIEGIFNE